MTYAPNREYNHVKNRQPRHCAPRHAQTGTHIPAGLHVRPWALPPGAWRCQDIPECRASALLRTPRQSRRACHVAIASWEAMFGSIIMTIQYHSLRSDGVSHVIQDRGSCTRHACCALHTLIALSPQHIARPFAMLLYHTLHNLTALI